MMEFRQRHLYTRREIADSLGGGVQDYLPHRNGRVMCACLSPELNPDAPDVVLVGTGPDIVRWGKVFAGQREYVPVFVKRGTNAWQYVGQYRVETSSTDDDEIARWESVSGRPGDIAMVLYLERESVANEAQSAAGRALRHGAIAQDNRRSYSLIDALRVPPALLLDFFVTFARFEYALKATGFSRDRHGGAEADWDRFIESAERLDSQELTAILSVGQGLLDAPPKKLVWRAETLDWQEVTRVGQTEIRFLLEAVKRAKNNLFHGGKFLTNAEPGDRNKSVVGDALNVLNTLLNGPWPFPLRQAFDE